MAETRARFSHVAVCSRDLDLSERFYCEGLGFRPRNRGLLGDHLAQLLDVEPPITGELRFLARGDVTVELVGFTTPEPVGGAAAQLTTRGVTHLSFLVDDVDAVGNRLEELGGRILKESRTTLPQHGEFLFCTDPDGVRIELMQIADPDWYEPFH